MGINEHYVITEVDRARRRYLPILLVGDESESMIDRYIDRGKLYVGFADDKPVAVCVTVGVEPDTVEVKNLAVVAGFRRRGYGRRMLEHVERRHPDARIILGTGETPSTLQFYESCGYSYSHRVPDFFIDNYPAPIIEEGVTLCDMIYLKKDKLAKTSDT